MTPFAPNCSEGAPTHRGADPIALSLDRLVQECPRRKVANLLGATTLLAEHGRGACVHFRYSVDGIRVCIPSPPSPEHFASPLFVPTDAQRDYWSRRGRA